MILDQRIELPAIARECDVSPQALEDWLCTNARKAPAFLDRIIEFIDDRTLVWAAMNADAAKGLRQDFANALLQNVKILTEELGQAAGRDDLRAHLLMYLDDLGRVVKLMEADAAKLPERLAAALRSLLEPGDKLLLARGGNKAGRVGVK